MKKAIPPILIVALFCCLTMGAALRSDAHLTFQALISGAFGMDESDYVFRRAAAELLFREAAIRPAAGEVEARQLGDLRFQLAEALSRSPDASLRDHAAEHYAAAIALEPSLRHGWPHFRLGEIDEQAGRSVEAMAHYRNVALYDSGSLALLALFRASTLEAASTSDPIDPRPVFAYLKYGSIDPERDILSFRSTEWRSFPEAFFLRAWQEMSSSQSNSAIEQLRIYLRQRPNEPAGLYWIGEWTGAHRAQMYPAGGGLLAYGYAPHANVQPSLRMPHEARFRAVYYRVDESAEPVTLRIRYRNLPQAPVRIHLSHNLDRKEFERPAREQDAFEVEFLSEEGRNVVEVYFYFPGVEFIPPALRWIYLDQARILPPSGESAL